MAVYAVVSGGFTVNIIVWDGVTQFNPGSGNTLVPIAQAPAAAVVSGGSATITEENQINALADELQSNGSLTSAQVTSALLSGTPVTSSGAVVSGGIKGSA